MNSPPHLSLRRLRSLGWMVENVSLSKLSQNTLLMGKNE